MIQMTGEEAFAFGAIDAGISMATAYPGSPGTGTINCILKNTMPSQIYVEWSVNERVALEMAIGASIAGKRSFVCVKNVGMNTIVDPLMTLNLTPLNGGIVIILGDDPGAYGSQNDQDTRSLIKFIEIPLFEPSSPSEAYQMVHEAYRLSEKFETPIVIRQTRSFSRTTGPVERLRDEASQPKGLGIQPFRFVPVPKNAVQKHAELHRRLASFREYTGQSGFNSIKGTGATGIAVAGFVYKKLMDILPEQLQIPILKVGLLYPLPDQMIVKFLDECDKILVLEETEPFLENELRIIASKTGIQVAIHGKEPELGGMEGEFFRWQIDKYLHQYLEGYSSKTEIDEQSAAAEIPERKNHCMDSGYDVVLDILAETADSLKIRPVLAGDPGCLAAVADRLHAKYAMGSAIGVADGLSRGADHIRSVAIFGDSSFFHSAIPAMCNASVNGSEITIVVLDNKSNKTTGNQPNPGSGLNARQSNTRELQILEIAKACGMQSLHRVNKNDQALLRKTFELCLVEKKLNFIHIVF